MSGSKAWFVRNESGGRGYRVTERGAALLRLWDIAGIILFVALVLMLVAEWRAPWWLYLLIGVAAAGPFVMGMFITGLGPIAFLTSQSRRMRGEK